MLLVLILTLCIREAYSSPSCTELGFSGYQSCSDCDTLGEYVKDAELVTDCKQCCTGDSQEDRQVYTSAVLEVCSYRLQGLPQIKDFIDKKAWAYEKLTVKYRTNALPRLILKGPQGKNEIRIDNWKSSTIIEFLNDKLQADQ